MCSFIGGVINSQHRKDLATWAKTLSHRGEAMGAGMIAYDPSTKQYQNSKSMVLKDTIKAVEALPDGAFYIMHQRKASVGAVGLELTHPVKSNNRDLWLMHNGTNRHLSSIFNAKSDSQGIATLLSYVFEGKTPAARAKSAEQVLKEIGVLFFVAGVKTGASLWMYKDEERPLVFNKEVGVLASEPLFAGEWAPVDDTTGKMQFRHIAKNKTLPQNFPHGDFVEVKTLGATALYCSTCKKTHLKEGGETMCATCKVLGAEPYVYTAPAASSSYTKTPVMQAGTAVSIPMSFVDFSAKNLQKTGKVDKGAWGVLMTHTYLALPATCAASKYMEVLINGTHVYAQVNLKLLRNYLVLQDARSFVLHTSLEGQVSALGTVVEATPLAYEWQGVVLRNVPLAAKGKVKVLIRNGAILAPGRSIRVKLEGPVPAEYIQVMVNQLPRKGGTAALPPAPKGKTMVPLCGTCAKIFGVEEPARKVIKTGKCSACDATTLVSTYLV